MLLIRLAKVRSAGRTTSLFLVALVLAVACFMFCLFQGTPKNAACPGLSYVIGLFPWLELIAENSEIAAGNAFIVYLSTFVAERADLPLCINCVGACSPDNKVP